MATSYSYGDKPQLLSEVESSKIKIEQFITKLYKDEGDARIIIMLESQLMRQKVDELEAKALENLKSTFDFYTTMSLDSLERCKLVIRDLQRDCLNESMKTDISRIKSFVNNELCFTSQVEDNMLSFQVDQGLKDYINNATNLGEIKLNKYIKQADDRNEFSETKSEDASDTVHNLTGVESGPENESLASSCSVSISETQNIQINSVAASLQSQSATTSNTELELTPSPAKSTSSITNQSEITLPSGPPKRAVYEISFIAKSLTDRFDCNISGACFLADRRLVLADQRNEKLKVFAVSLQIQAEVALGSKPFDVVETKTGEIVVTMPDKQHIQFYDGALKYLEDVDTHQPCLGISTTKENIFVLCEATESKPCCINIYNASKQLVSKMTKGGPGKPLLKGSEYVTVCNTANVIFFARRTFEECKIYCMDLSGNVKWKSNVSSADISEASFSLAAVEEGVVIAADCVRCISNKGKTKKKLMSSREKGLPYAIAVNADRSMMMVTYFAPEFGDSKSNNFVNLFRLFY